MTARAFSSEAGPLPRQENVSSHESRAPLQLYRNGEGLGRCGLTARDVRRFANWCLRQIDPTSQHDDDAQHARNDFAAVAADSQNAALLRTTPATRRAGHRTARRKVPATSDEPLDRSRSRRRRSSPASAAPAHTRIGRRVEQRHDQRSSRDDQGNADRKPEDQQRNAAIGGGGDRDDVVEAHHDVGDRHDLHRRPQMRRRDRRRPRPLAPAPAVLPRSRAAPVRRPA